MATEYVNLSQTSDLDSKLSAAFRQLHSLAASMGDAKNRYEQTHDARYLQSVADVYPLYVYWYNEYKEISAELGDKQMPSNFMLTLQATSDWLAARGVDVVEIGKDVAKGAVDLTKWLVVGIVAVSVAYVGGPFLRSLKKR